MTKFDFLRRLSAFGLFSALIFNSALSAADDTEVFFGGPQSSQGIKPNVLFLLDNSGSMAWRLDSDSTNLNGTPSRMDVLKQSFNDIITNTSGINVGVMVLNARSDYGSTRTVNPVEFIDGPVGINAVAPEILVSADDASRQSSTTVIDSPTLVMGHINNHTGNSITRNLSNSSGYSNENSSYYIRNNYSCSVKIGTARTNCPSGIRTTLNARNDSAGESGLFLFRNLNIPAGATITSARLSLTAANSNATKPGFNVRLEKSKTPSAYNDDTSISDRDFSAINLNLSNAQLPTAAWSNNQPFILDITSLVQSLQSNSPSADPIGDLGLQVRARSASNYNYYVGDDLGAPTLTITYTAATASARTTGLRFQNVAIPRGATITSARIDFVPASSDDRPLTLQVNGQSGNATPFSTSEDFTSRTKVAAMQTWQPSEWRTENPPTYLEGPSVLNIAQEIVSSANWCGNDAMAFFLTPTAGDGNRTTFSIDGSSLKPVLRITYQGGDGGCLKPVFEARVTAPKNDAREYCNVRSNGSCRDSVNVGETNMTLGGDTTFVGIRYENMPVLRNATVEDAQIIVTRGSGTGSAAVTVHVHNADNSAELLANSGNLSDRVLVGGSSGGLSCSLSGEQSICRGPELNSALQSLFARSGWSDGNALSILLKRNSGSDYSVATYENSPGASVKLRLKLGNGGMGTNYKTVRNHINGLVSTMTPSGGTPLVPSMHEAALYLSQKYHQGSNASPITSACQATHLVVLTDGKPEGTTNTALNDISAKAGSCADVANLTDAKCGVELARWLSTTDQSSFDGDNYVNTHTVGFALNARPGAEGTAIRKFLSDVATAGGGGAYSAENASDLSKAFNKILQQVLATDTTFVSATAPVNTFNRQDNKDELYFSLFRPATTDRWAGNLKRYRMTTSNGQAVIVDLDGQAAIDTNTGLFRSDARSWWSASNDGNSVVEGGAAKRLPAPALRNLLTNVANDNSLSALSIANSNLTAAMLGASNSTERDNLINYIRGFDPNAPTVARQALGDPIHATPSVVSYGCTDSACTSERQIAVIGTNEGFVHLFDTNTGNEQSAFMPRELLTNIKRLRANEATGSNAHVYGMDNSVIVWSNDANNDGTISGGSDFVYAYATMGRGGRSIYALNITNPTSPSLLWSRNNTDTGFGRLGQTWSAPVRAKIDVGGTDTDVLIFGGGYDPAQDGKTTRSTDSQGNDLFIVNAKTGALLWSASAAGINMQYSVPSKVKVTSLQVDNGIARMNPEGLAEQIFVGDTGGQVWRFRINNGASAGSNLASGNVFANLSGANTADNRRFYHEPELALVAVENQLNLTVSIGSGFRGHPLNTVVEDRFYSMRTTELDGASSTLTETALYDATSLVTATEAQREVLLESPGWYVRLTRPGEKVMSNALAIDGVLYFNTYEPKSEQDSCSATQGVSYAYRVNLLDGTAVNNTRYSTIKGASLPSNPQLFCKGDTCWVYNDPSNLIPTNKPACPVGQKCDDECLPGEACAVDVSAKSRLYWADEED